MREIILDTETTGLNPSDGHRIIEIGCLELYNHLPTGKVYHQYINPQRDVPLEAFRVHGLSEDFLRDKPVFSEIVEDFLNFIEGSPLIIHNASFDMKFLNYELASAKYPKLKMSRTVDTLIIAREKFPGSPASLDALCKRFKIDNSNRTKHGALLDSELLAEVYLELKGGRQQNLSFSSSSMQKENIPINIKKAFRESRIFTPTNEEVEQHENFMKKICG